MSTNETSVFRGRGATQLVQRMGEAAANFVAALASDQRSRAVIAFENEDERRTWHYTPTARRGLPFTEMDRNQQRLAQRLIALGLSRAGYVTMSTIMGLETTLDAIEEWSAELWWRDSRLYYLTIFGTPDNHDPWGWRFEGHHISLNYTVIDGRIVAPTPSFFGSNPANSPLGPTTWLRPLGAREDLARELVRSLDAEQQDQALVTEITPSDIITGNSPRLVDDMLSESVVNGTLGKNGAAAQLEAVRYTTRPKGLAAAAMSAPQRSIMIALVGEYISRMPDELAEIEQRRLEESGVDGLHFVWAGATVPNQAHYYRLQGPRMLIEYDNIQNDANHIHSVWRDPENDFGADLLTRHYTHAH